MAQRLTVVISQGQSQNPSKRQLEENLVGGLLGLPGIDVMVVPHLYDLSADGTGILALQGAPGQMVVLSWLFPRAARWTLDRQGIRGAEGTTLLRSAEEEAAEDEEEPTGDEDDGGGEAKVRVAALRSPGQRKIYCIDLRARNQAEAFIEEIKRIHTELNTQVVSLGGWIGGSPQPEQLARFQSPTNDTALSQNGGVPSRPLVEIVPTQSAPAVLAESTERRWYPVIDFSRCTNCMECIDFCLFGVYGVDRQETILVEQPDNCRKGCPACSRVCPENAIIFPQHKSPEIAGAPSTAGSLKIDLSQLFGAPAGDPLATAARERDEQLVLAGRDAVGLTVGIPKRQQHKATGPKDELDKLVDQLDELDL